MFACVLKAVVYFDFDSHSTEYSTAAILLTLGFVAFLLTAVSVLLSVRYLMRKGLTVLFLCLFSTKNQIKCTVLPLNMSSSKLHEKCSNVYQDRT